MAVAAVVVGTVLDAALLRGGPPPLEARWRLRAGGAVVGGPVLESTTVFVATRSGELVAADVETGAARWRFETGERALAAPSSAGGLVYLATQVAGSDAGHVFGVDARTGTEQWRVVVDAPFSGRLALSGGLVLVSAGEVIALDGATGEERWRSPAGTGADPIAAGVGLAVVAAPDGLVALDAASGDARWSALSLAPPQVAPALGEEVAVAVDGTGALVGLDAGDGSERWRLPDPGLVQPPVVAGSVVALATAEGVVVLDGETGERRWQAGVDGGEEGVRVDTDGVRVAATSAGRLTLLGLPGGEVVGTAGLTGEARASPAVGPGRTYVAQGEVLAAFEDPPA